MKTETSEELQERLRREAARRNTEYRPLTHQQVKDAKRLNRGLATLESYR